MQDDFIYLDHAAATPLDEQVLSAMKPYFDVDFFNPSSPYSPAVRVRREYESAKASLASSIGAKADELVMTAGATESINLAFSAAGDGQVIVPTTEHHAVLAAARLHEHVMVDVDDTGRVQASDIKKVLSSGTTLVSVAFANNELGTVQPLREIASVIDVERKRRLEQGELTPLYFHTDASQGAGLLDINVSRLGVDLLTLNAGKVYGPKQVGLLWVRRGVRLEPRIVGGGQEAGMRSGTENVSGVIGFAKAMELAVKRKRNEVERIGELRNQLESALTNEFTEAVITGSKKHRLASHLHISFPGIDAERLVFGLESRGVLVATGSACAANKGTRSHVLTAIGVAPETADGSLRLTLGHLNNGENTERAVVIIKDVVRREYERTRR